LANLFLQIEVQKSETVVLKREPLGSPREEVLIPGRKFAPWKNWGGKAVGKKQKFLFVLVYSTLKNCTERLD